MQQQYSDEEARRKANTTMSAGTRMEGIMKDQGSGSGGGSNDLQLIQQHQTTTRKQQKQFHVHPEDEQHHRKSASSTPIRQNVSLRTNIASMVLRQRWSANVPVTASSDPPMTQLAKTLVSSLLLLLLVPLLTTNAQEIGVDLCACQPSTYEFVFNFSLTCDDRNVGGPGVQDAACVLNTEGEQNVTDFTPVIVTRILVLELNQDFGVIAQTPIVGEYTNGSIFRYTSVIASQDVSTLEPEDVPKGLQLSMAGRNKDEQDLVNFWLILYDNDCGVYPVILEGQRIGWTILVSLTWFSMEH